MRLGVDFGGTKIELAVLDERGDILLRERAPNPGAYHPALALVRDLVQAAEASLALAPGASAVGVGLPGSPSPATGLMRNANSVWLNGRPFGVDLARALGRPVKLANDANCFALSEAVDGAGAGLPVVFGVIVGTGCGGGVVVDGRLVEGANGVGGEWGHTPLPWMTGPEQPGPPCWCGRRGCLETFVSGRGFERDYASSTGQALSAEAIVADARAGRPDARAALERYVDRLGRGLAVVCDLLDPDVIVLGGGMSNVGELYHALPPVLARHIFSDVCRTRIVPALHGDSSGVRGAAWL